MVVRIIVAEDHAFTREGLQHALQASGFIKVCATAPGGIAAIAQARIHQPDVALLDFAMPDASGLEVVSEITRWSPATRCIILTGNTNPEILARIAGAGVAGLFTKGCPVAQVVEGILRAARGERVISAAAQESLDSAGTTGGMALTDRERQVLQRIAHGLTTPDIADALALSPKTIDSHRMSLMRKLEVNNAPALVLAAIRRGLIDADIP